MNDREPKGSASAKSNRNAGRKRPARRAERPLFTRAIKVRLPEEDHARLAEDAQIAELTISEIVRRRYFGRPILAHADMVTVRELRRLGGLLKLSLSTGNRAEIQNALGALGKAIDRLSRPPAPR